MFAKYRKKVICWGNDAKYKLFPRFTHSIYGLSGSYQSLVMCVIRSDRKTLFPRKRVLLFWCVYFELPFQLKRFRETWVPCHYSSYPNLGGLTKNGVRIVANSTCFTISGSGWAWNCYMTLLKIRCCFSLSRPRVTIVYKRTAQIAAIYYRLVSNLINLWLNPAIQWGKLSAHAVQTIYSEETSYSNCDFSLLSTKAFQFSFSLFNLP